MNTMQPSIWTAYFRHLSPENCVLALQEAGFSHGEFSLGHSIALQNRDADVEKTGLAYRAFLADVGFSVPEGHLDFHNDLTTPETVDALKKEITLFQAIGIQHAVIHINGGMELPEAVRREKQMRHMRQLLEFVQGTDFTICIENLRSNPAVADADKILGWIHELGDKNLGICLDTGHLHTTNITLLTSNQTQEEFILKAGKYLKALHINGNDGTDDYHLAPYSIKNSVNWPEVVTSLRKIGYNGLFNLEIPGETAGDPPVFVLKQKLLYLKALLDYMLSEHFPE